MGDNQKRYDDTNEFDIFLVMTGGATFDKGESSLEKVKCQKTADGDLQVLSSDRRFAPDLYEASVGRPGPTGMADHDAGGDHAWPDGMSSRRAKQTTLTLRASTELVSLVLPAPPSSWEHQLARTPTCACPFRTFQLLRNLWRLWV